MEDKTIMKAWIVTQKDEFGALVIFAETRGKARSIAIRCDEFDSCEFCDIDVRRVPDMDKYWKPGSVIMDWELPSDRIALVKECGFRCSLEYVDWEDCRECCASAFCDLYNDHISEEEE